MLNVAVIGCGKNTGGMEGFGIGYAHADGWRGLDGPVRLFGVDINGANLADFGTHYGLPAEQLFASTEALYRAHTPDFVSVCTWPGLHAAMVVEAAEAGVRGVVCEKPLALNAADLERMRTACRDHGVALAAAHQRRYNPYFEGARTLLQEGRLGAPHVLEARVGGGWDVLSWATHWFDLANDLFGSEPEWVLAGADLAGTRRYDHPVEDGSVVLAQYPGAQQALFVTGPDNPHPNPVTVRGTDGLLKLYEERDAELFSRKGYETFRPAAVQDGTFDVHDYRSGFRFLIADFVAATSRGEASRCDVAATAAATETALAVHESVRTRRKVQLPLAVKFSPLELLERAPRPAAWGRRTLLYADDHYGSGGREGVREALAAITGHPPTVVSANEPLGEETVADADVLCLYHTREHADEATKRTLTNWVAQGKPLLLLHAALGAYPAWPEYREWLGYVWQWGSSSHPHEPTTLVPAAGDPLGFGWASAWLPPDEVYVDLERVSDALVGLYTVLCGSTYPVAWVSAAHPNVGCWMPGHRRDSWQVPAMRAGLAALLARLVREGGVTAEKALYSGSQKT